uniref:CD3 epsilon chain n=1 Tax=Acipenser ruthenus TaxID=7906 RepID=Q9W732_ACIRT|nr:CD3 epsilon chain [Acipenser ruthenus]
MKPTMKKAASLLLALFIAVCSDLVSSEGGEGEDQTGSVDVSGTSVTLTCPLIVSDPGSTTWQYKEEKEKIPDTDVCETCVEVEVVPMIGIIFADLLVTAGVAILVYYWAQNRKGASAMAPARPGRQNRAPPVPNPDYEPIRTGNREVYSGLNKRT